jgi:DNA-binding CsgD family transcriptional regulator
MLTDTQIQTIGIKMGRWCKNRSMWLEEEEVVQEAVAVAFEIMYAEFDPDKWNHGDERLENWLRSRVIFRLVDWQRKQKDRYYGRPNLQSSFAITRVSYDQEYHQQVHIELGYWFIEELSAYIKPVKSRRITKSNKWKRVMITKLTARECELLTHLSNGLYAVDAGKAMFIGVETVKTSLKTIRQKLDAKNTTHAVAIALRTGDIT